MDFLKRHAIKIVGLMLMWLFVVSMLVSSQESAIYDEKAHIPAAYTYLDAQDMRLNPEHPPLIKDFAAFPLTFLNLSFPYNTPEWQNGANEQWALGDLFINCTDPSQACNDADSILLWSRLPIILIAVTLGIALFFWTRKLGGAIAGLFAVVLYVFDPNIIAHSHYVTTDIGIAAFIFFAAYFFINFLKAPNVKHIFLAGIFLGLAELTKFSAVLLFPVFGLFTLLYAATLPKTIHDKTHRLIHLASALFSYIWKYIAVVLICFITIWIVYAFNTAQMPADKVTQLADLFLSQPNTPAQISHSIIVSMSNHPLLLPFAEYFVGIAKVFSRVGAGNIYYYFETVSSDASASYFPVVFMLKETLPFLFLLIMTTLYSLYRIGKSFWEERVVLGSLWKLFARSFQEKITQYLAVFFVLFYAFVSITGNLNIGFRHLFPILPFLYMLIAKTTFDFFKRHSEEETTQKILSTILIGVTLSIIAIPILAYPNYLSYFNAAVGGHENGYRYVTDSNYDWGQDMKRLRIFIDRHNACVQGTDALCDPYLGILPPVEKIRVDYFGGASPVYYLGNMYISWWEKRAPEPGWYAISSFFYQESLYKEKPAEEQDYSWLKDKTPVARAGDSIFIYYIPE